MFGLGFSEIILVLVIFILLFGPKEIPIISKKLAKFYRDVLKVKDDFNDSVKN